MSAHTPGPWMVSDPDNCGEACEHCVTTSEADAGRRWYVATAHDFGDNGLTSNTNAHLIAAAPDLLTALEELVDQARQVVHGERSHVSAAAWHAGEIAIAKARGGK